MVDGFDYNLRKDQSVIFEQLERDDPWLTIILWPCGHWGRAVAIREGSKGAG